jgi:predicted transcriptional regulator
VSVDIVATKDDVTAVEIATRIIIEVFNGLPTIDDNGIVIGMITTIDLLCAIRDGKILKLMFARDLMTKNPLVVTQDTKIEDVIDIVNIQELV